MERRGRPRGHHRGAEQARRAQREAELLVYRPAALANSVSGREVRIPVDPQVRRRVRTGEVLAPVPGSTFGPLVAWLRSGNPTWPGLSAPRPAQPAGSVRPHTVDPDLERAKPGWLAEQLQARGFAARDPDVGMVGWLDRHMIH